MRAEYLTAENLDYICGYYCGEPQPVDVEIAELHARFANKEPDFTPKPGIWAAHFNYKLTKQMIVDGINKLFDEHGLFCVKQTEIGRENWKAWFAMIYPEIYPYAEMEYVIGWNNKKLKAMRLEVEKIWKKNAEKGLVD